MIEGKIAKPLKKMLKKLASDEVQAQLAVADSKLGGIIREGKDLDLFVYFVFRLRIDKSVNKTSLKQLDLNVFILLLFMN